MEFSQLARNMVDQATREVNAIFGGGNGWVNDSSPQLAPLKMGFLGGASLKTTQRATTFASGKNAPNAGTTAASFHRTLMGGTPTQHDSGV